MFSVKGDTVLDPFLGSGTTTKVSMQNGRNSVGYETDENLLPLIKGKIGLDRAVSASDYNVSVVGRAVS
jgi:DNA modification methylase